MQQELERIFRFWGSCIPHLDLHSVYFGLQSKDLNVYDNALEFLENVLKSQLRSSLLPLLDGKVTSKQRAALAERLCGQKWEIARRPLRTTDQRRPMAEILWCLCHRNVCDHVSGR